MSFAYFHLHHALDRNSHVEALYDYSYAEKSPWVKKTKKKKKKKTGPKKNERDKRKKKKHVLQCDVFPGNRDLLSGILKDPVFHWFAVLLGVIMSRRGAGCLRTFTS